MTRARAFGCPLDDRRGQFVGRQTFSPLKAVVVIERRDPLKTAQQTPQLMRDPVEIRRRSKLNGRREDRELLQVRCKRRVDEFSLRRTFHTDGQANQTGTPPRTFFSHRSPRR